MMKATTLLYGMLVFYILGKYEKIPRHAMNLVWSFSLGGCLFLSIGLFLNNYELIRGGLFISGILAILLIHIVLTKYQTFKERIDNEINPK
jgi:hypothetical protein